MQQFIAALVNNEISSTFYIDGAWKQKTQNKTRQAEYKGNL